MKVELRKSEMRKLSCRSSPPAFLTRFPGPHFYYVDGSVLLRTRPLVESILYIWDRNGILSVSSPVKISKSSTISGNFRKISGNFRIDFGQSSDKFFNTPKWNSYLSRLRVISSIYTWVERELMWEKTLHEIAQKALCFRTLNAKDMALFTPWRHFSQWHKCVEFTEV